MNTGELYQDYSDDGELVASQEPKQPDTITIPVDELSGEVDPGVRLEVVSVEDGIVTLKIVSEEEGPSVSEASATV